VVPEETDVIGQWLGKNIHAAMNVHATTDELLGTMLPMCSVPYQVLDT
jgi:hypothetical protein